MGLIPDKDEQEMVRRALDPKTVEARMLRQAMASASNQVQEQVRSMLHQMIDLVPGQLFRDIGRFHEKFELKPTDDPGHRLPDDVIKFRIKFMREELQEYEEAVSYSPTFDVINGNFDAELAFDALIDLVYVALGTAYLHRFPFNEGWDRVQAANMKKVRASGDDDPLSKRKHSKDVVKPPGWVPPVLIDLLDEKCPECKGTGEVAQHVDAGCFDYVFCDECQGTGRRRSGAKAPPERPA